MLLTLGGVPILVKLTNVKVINVTPFKDWEAEAVLY